MSDEKVVVSFPISPEERQRRLMVEINRLADLAMVDWAYQLQKREKEYTELASGAFTVSMSGTLRWSRYNFGTSLGEKCADTRRGSGSDDRVKRGVIESWKGRGVS